MFLRTILKIVSSTHLLEETDKQEKTSSNPRIHANPLQAKALVVALLGPVGAALCQWHL